MEAGAEEEIAEIAEDPTSSEPIDEPIDMQPATTVEDDPSVEIAITQARTESEAPAAIVQEALEHAADDSMAAKPAEAPKVRKGKTAASEGKKKTARDNEKIAKGLTSWAAAIDGDDEAAMLVEAVLKIQKRVRVRQARVRAEAELRRRRELAAAKIAKDKKANSGASTPRSGPAPPIAAAAVPTGGGKSGTGAGRKPSAAGAGAQGLGEVLGGTGSLTAGGEDSTVPAAAAAKPGSAGTGPQAPKASPQPAAKPLAAKPSAAAAAASSGEAKVPKGKQAKATASAPARTADVEAEAEAEAEAEDEEEEYEDDDDGVSTPRKAAPAAGGRGALELSAADEAMLAQLAEDKPLGESEGLARVWRLLVRSRAELLRERTQLRASLAQAQQEAAAARTKDVMRIEKLAQTNTLLQTQLKELNSVVAQIVTAKKGQFDQVIKPIPPALPDQVLRSGAARAAYRRSPQ